ncbi:FtsX-like permease family protein [Agromyces soli]
MSRRSRLSTTGLLWRQFAASPTASVLLAVLVAVAAFAATALPRAVAMLHTEAIAAQMQSVEAWELDLTASTRDRPPVGPGDTPLPDDVDEVWGTLFTNLEAVHDALPSPLGDVVGDPLALVVGDPVVASFEGQAPGGTVYRVQPGFDPALREHVRLTDGDWPEAFTGAVPGDDPVELVLADAVAERLEWQVGDERALDFPTGTVPAVLTGTFAPLDAADPFWSHVPTALAASRQQEGLGPPIITGVAMLDPASWQVFQSVSMPIRLQLWFPLDPEAVRGDQLDLLVDQLGEVSSRVEPLAPSEVPLAFRTADSVTFTSGLRDVLVQARDAAVAVDAVLATVASGPIGVTVAVLVLGALVVFERRRPGLELAAARGASQGQLRGILAGEGAAIGVPAALLGGAAGMLAVPADAGLGAWWLVAAFALAPALLLVSSAGRLSPLRRARSDLGRAGGGRYRWIAELAVLLVTVAAVVLLFRRGLSSDAADSADGSGAGGVDPLLAAVPLLAALVVCVAVLRLYPLPLARLVAVLERRRGLVPFLGAARALRDPSAGLVPVLAVVVGVAIAVFSSVLLGTVRGGVEVAAEQQVGADLKLAASPLTTQQLEALAATPGVEATAPVYSTSSSVLQIDARRRPTTLIVVDVAEMNAVQQGREHVVPLPEELAAGEPTDRPVPVIASASVAERIAAGDRVSLDDEEIEVLFGSDAATAFSTQPDWLLVDRSKARPFTDTLVPRTVLFRLSPDADVEQVTADVLEIAGDDSVATTPESRATELGARPAARGLTLALAIAIVLTSLATALAIVLTLVVGRPARERLLPLLSTLGLGRRGERALVAWEIGPVVVAAVVAGALLGIGLPLVVLPAIDLGAFTDAGRQPDIVIDPWLVAGVLGGAMLVAALAAWIAASVGGRVDAARAMRKEEES